MKDLDRLETLRERYGWLRPGWAPATAVYQGRVAKRLAPDVRVLDLGCGRGGIVERLGDRGHWVGADPDLPSLREHRVSALPRTCAHSRRLPFPAATFDVVVASWVLEHLATPEETFGEIARVLRPRGGFFFLTPNARHPLPRLSRVLAQSRARGSRWRLQSAIVKWIYGRASADTFPVVYRANTVQDIERLGVMAGLRVREIALIEDPSYFASGGMPLALAIALEGLFPASWRVHLVGELWKPD
ncbi:MAG: class I SAM-dependent methyltransferase [Anaerolineae bacterium]